MVHDEPVVHDESVARPHGVAGRALLFAGVAGACMLGAGLGMWARPSDIERPGAPAAKPAPVVAPISVQRRLPIVVDDTPAPLGKPMDVLAASPPRPALIPRHVLPARPAPEPELLAPKRPPNGLVRVTAPAPGPIAPASSRRLAEEQAMQAHALRVRAAAEVAAEARAAKRKAEAAQARAEQARLHAVRLAKAEQARHRAEVAAEQKAEAKAERLAALRARHEKLLAAKAHALQLAKAAPPPPRARHGLAILTHALAKLTPHRPPPRVERAEAKPERHRKPAEHETRLAKVSPAPTSTTPHAGTIRVANISSRCASADPGEALACGDPNLGAAERRMTRAYRDAEAAGVPTSTLQQQQARWKTARAAAAREAPWAVREVYQARIAELQDLARDAQGGDRRN